MTFFYSFSGVGNVFRYDQHCVHAMYRRNATLYIQSSQQLCNGKMDQSTYNAISTEYLRFIIRQPSEDELLSYSRLDVVLKSILHRAFYWNNLRFGLKRTDYMYTGKYIHNESFQHRRLRDYGNIELSPAAGVLNYGKGCLDSLFSTTIWRLDMFLGVVWIAYFQQPFWHLDTLSRPVWVSHFNNHFGTVTCS
ncbi:Aminotransferase, class IV [Artemisia annua]|uniref:Aminotransferase, class IV n=1 Tax=Artemisia annua TaxID=35608 RepID=A0A2U1P790_ARTAN|nr:Aminotransferase, class IV [Artemisia annua]